MTDEHYRIEARIDLSAHPRMMESVHQHIMKRGFPHRFYKHLADSMISEFVAETEIGKWLQSQRDSDWQIEFLRHEWFVFITSDRDLAAMFKLKYG